MKVIGLVKAGNGYLVLECEDDKILEFMVFKEFAELTDWLYRHFDEDKKET